MVSKNSMELTEDEEELYDRQIRLWGLESQKRLRSARVLVIGMNGLGAEVVKNIILAGVKSVKMIDSEVVSELDCHSQFLVPVDAIGHNRAEASLDRARALNQLVSVSAEKCDVSKLPDEYFVPWEVIVAIGQTTAQLVRVDSICRANKVKFFCGDVFGAFGYMFADLQSHEFLEVVPSLPPKPVKGTTPAIQPETLQKSVKRKIEFPSLDDALEVDFASEENGQKLANMDSVYFVLKTLLRFRLEEKRDPDPSKINEDFDRLLKLRDVEVSQIPSLKDKIPNDVFRMIFSQLSPVCAIVGGVISQEIIKAISQQDPPHNNMFFFNPLTNRGHIVSVGD